MRKTLMLGLVAGGLAGLVLAHPAEARRHPYGAHRAPSAPGYSTLVIDAKTGQVLEADNADAEHYPASLTKMMTLYLTFDCLRHGKLRLDQPLPISAYAARQAPSKLDLTPGHTITVEQAILALTVKSANDVAVVLSEAIGGSEAHFAELMTARAHELGMRSTTFLNASGLPNPGEVTTARDMATLARAIIRDFPQYYHFFSARDFAFQGAVIPTHNHVLNRFEGADGLKTGYTHAAGWNIVISAQRDGRRLIAVVLGGRSAPDRDRAVMHLLEVAFETPAPLHVAGDQNEGERTADTARLVSPAVQPAKYAPAAAVATAAEPQPAPPPAAQSLGPVVEPSATMAQFAGARPAPLNLDLSKVLADATKGPLAAAKPAAETGNTLAQPAKAESAKSGAPAAGPAVAMIDPPVPSPEPAKFATAKPLADVRVADRAADSAEGDAADERPSVRHSAAVERSGGGDSQDWAIQIGAYARFNLAHESALRIAHSTPTLSTSAISIGKAHISGTTVYRARLVGLTERQARSACATLARRRAPCFVIGPSADRSVAQVSE